MLNWKFPSLYKIEDVLLKMFESVLRKEAKEFSFGTLIGNALPWMTEYRTIVSDKDPRKGNAIGSYRATACLCG